MIDILLMQAAVQRDTIVTVAARDAVDLAMALAAISVAITFGAVLLVIVFALLGVRRAASAMSDLRSQVAADPAMEHLRRTAHNIESISESMRGEVSRFSSSVAQLSERLTQASDRLEERIEDFNALMEVVQDEAESAFVDGAATVKGVRAGLGKLSGRDRTRQSEPSARAAREEELSPNAPTRLHDEAHLGSSVLDGDGSMGSDDIRD